MHILFLSAWFPYPPNNGSKLRIYNLLRGLAQAHEVSLISLAEDAAAPVPEALRAICREVRVIPDRPYNAASTRALLGLLSPTPRVLVDRHSPEMAAAIWEAIDSGQYDRVVASQWYMAAYLDAARGLPAIFEEAEVGVFHDKVAHAASLAGRLRHRLTTLKMQAYFRGLLRRFTAVTVASPAERDLLQAMAPGYSRVEVIPNGVDLAGYAGPYPEPAPDSLIFTGSFRYSANWEAMEWFVGQVYPLIKQRRPGACLTITGDHAGRPLPPAEGVTLTGFVDDVRPLVASSWISLAPLLSGGGTRLKILEAMALRTPVIATRKGAEGLDAQPGEHLLLADDPAEFAAATVRLLEEPGLRRRLVENAYRLVRSRYDWAVIWPQFLKLVERA